MTARPIRLLAAIAVALLLGSAGARAGFNPLESYWENVARAVAANNAYAVHQALSDGRSPNETDDKGRAGLHIAAIDGNLQIAAILLKAKARLNVRDRLGNTPLHLAAQYDRVEMAKLFIDLGAPIDAQNRDGLTPLMIAARRGNIDIVRALLAKGADPKKTDYTGRDALSWVAGSHRSMVIEALRRAVARR